MNLNEREEIRNAYVNKIRLFEKKYAKKIDAVIKGQIEKVLSALEKHGVGAAKHEAAHIIIDKELSETLMALYKDVGSYFAKHTYMQIKHSASQKAGGIGSNPNWIQRITNYFQSRLLDRAVVPINNTTRDRIQNVLIDGEQEGLGTEEMARQMRSPDFSMNRANLISRTESGKAASVGRQIAADAIDFKLSKEWISAEDALVRPAHAEQDGIVIDEDQNFNVDGEEMSAPSDPTASPENICNCRCSLAFIPKRGNDGRFIQKN